MGLVRIVTWEETIRSSDAWQVPDNHHSSGFAHRALARIHTREPFEALQFGLRSFFALYQGIDVGFFFRYKLQLQMAFGGMIINAVTPDFHEPRGQDVQGEPAKELDSVEGYRLFNSPVAIILGYEGHLSVSYVQDALVGDRYPVRILSQIFYHMISTGQRRLAVYHPTGLICLLHVNIEKREFIAFSQGALKAAQESALKGFTQLMDRIQIAAQMSDILPLPIEGISGCRDNAMDVWV